MEKLFRRVFSVSEQSRSNALLSTYLLLKDQYNQSVYKSSAYLVSDKNINDQHTYLVKLK